MDSEVVALQAGARLQTILERLARLVAGLVLVAAVIGAATFATGWWVFDGSRGAWTVIGGALCLAPVVAATIAWWLVRSTARYAPRLATDVKELANTSMSSARVILDHDTGQPIGAYAKSFGALRGELLQRRRELPALFTGIRAITSVPGLAAITVLGLVVVGGLGTILLIGGLID